MAICFTLKESVWIILTIFLTAVCSTDFNKVLPLIKPDPENSQNLNQFLQELVNKRKDLEWVDRLSQVYKGFDPFTVLNKKNLFLHTKINRNVADLKKRGLRRRLLANYKINHPLFKTKLKHIFPFHLHEENLKFFDGDRNKRDLKQHQMEIQDIDNGMIGVLKKRNYKTQHVQQKRDILKKQKFTNNNVENFNELTNKLILKSKLKRNQLISFSKDATKKKLIDKEDTEKIHSQFDNIGTFQKIYMNKGERFHTTNRLIYIIPEKNHYISTRENVYQPMLQTNSTKSENSHEPTSKPLFSSALQPTTSPSDNSTTTKNSNTDIDENNILDKLKPVLDELKQMTSQKPTSNQIFLLSTSPSTTPTTITTTISSTTKNQNTSVIIILTGPEKYVYKKEIRTSTPFDLLGLAPYDLSTIPFSAQAPKDMIHSNDYTPNQAEKNIYIEKYNHDQNVYNSKNDDDQLYTSMKAIFLNTANNLHEKPINLYNFNYEHPSNNKNEELTPEEMRKAQIEAKKLMDVDKEFNERNEPDFIPDLSEEDNNSDYNFDNANKSSLINIFDFLGLKKSKNHPNMDQTDTKKRHILNSPNGYSNDVYKSKRKFQKRKLLSSYDDYDIDRQFPRDLNYDNNNENENFEYNDRLRSNYEVLPYRNYLQKISRRFPNKKKRRLRNYFKRSKFQKQNYIHRNINSRNTKEINYMFDKTTDMTTNDKFKKIKTFFGIGNENNYNEDISNDYPIADEFEEFNNEPSSNQVKKVMTFKPIYENGLKNKNLKDHLYQSEEVEPVNSEKIITLKENNKPMLNQVNKIDFKTIAPGILRGLDASQIPSNNYLKGVSPYSIDITSSKQQMPQSTYDKMLQFSESYKNTDNIGIDENTRIRLPTNKKQDTLLTRSKFNIKTTPILNSSKSIYIATVKETDANKMVTQTPAYNSQIYPHHYAREKSENKYPNINLKDDKTNSDISSEELQDAKLNFDKFSPLEQKFLWAKIREKLKTKSNKGKTRAVRDSKIKYDMKKFSGNYDDTSEDDDSIDDYSDKGSTHMELGCGTKTKYDTLSIINAQTTRGTSDRIIKNEVKPPCTRPTTQSTTTRKHFDLTTACGAHPSSPNNQVCTKTTTKIVTQKPVTHTTTTRTTQTTTPRTSPASTTSLWNLRSSSVCHPKNSVSPIPVKEVSSQFTLTHVTCSPRPTTSSKCLSTKIVPTCNKELVTCTKPFTTPTTTRTTTTTTTTTTLRPSVLTYAPSTCSQNLKINTIRTFLYSSKMTFGTYTATTEVLTKATETTIPTTDYPDNDNATIKAKQRLDIEDEQLIETMNAKPVKEESPEFEYTDNYLSDVVIENGPEIIEEDIDETPNENNMTSTTVTPCPESTEKEQTINDDNGNPSTCSDSPETTMQGSSDFLFETTVESYIQLSTDASLLDIDSKIYTKIASQDIGSDEAAFPAPNEAYPYFDISGYDTNDVEPINTIDPKNGLSEATDMFTDLMNPFSEMPISESFDSMSQDSESETCSFKRPLSDVTEDPVTDRTKELITDKQTPEVINDFVTQLNPSLTFMEHNFDRNTEMNILNLDSAVKYDSGLLTPLDLDIERETACSPTKHTKCKSSSLTTMCPTTCSTTTTSPCTTTTTTTTPCIFYTTTTPCSTTTTCRPTTTTTTACPTTTTTCRPTTTCPTTTTTCRPTTTCPTTTTTCSTTTTCPTTTTCRTTTTCPTTTTTCKPTTTCTTTTTTCKPTTTCTTTTTCRPTTTCPTTTTTCRPTTCPTTTTTCRPTTTCPTTTTTCRPTTTCSTTTCRPTTTCSTIAKAVQCSGSSIAPKNACYIPMDYKSAVPVLPIKIGLSNKPSTSTSSNKRTKMYTLLSNTNSDSTNKHIDILKLIDDLYSSTTEDPNSKCNKQISPVTQSVSNEFYDEQLSRSKSSNGKSSIEMTDISNSKDSETQNPIVKILEIVRNDGGASLTEENAKFTTGYNIKNVAKAAVTPSEIKKLNVVPETTSKYIETLPPRLNHMEIALQDNYRSKNILKRIRKSVTTTEPFQRINEYYRPHLSNEKTKFCVCDQPEPKPKKRKSKKHKKKHHKIFKIRHQRIKASTESICPPVLPTCLFETANKIKKSVKAAVITSSTSPRSTTIITITTNTTPKSNTTSTTTITTTTTEEETTTTTTPASTVSQTTKRTTRKRLSKKASKTDTTTTSSTTTTTKPTTTTTTTTATTATTTKTPKATTTTPELATITTITTPTTPTTPTITTTPTTTTTTTTTTTPTTTKTTVKITKETTIAETCRTGKLSKTKANQNYECCREEYFTNRLFTLGPVIFFTTNISGTDPCCDRFKDKRITGVTELSLDAAISKLKGIKNFNTSEAAPLITIILMKGTETTVAETIPMPQRNIIKRDQTLYNNHNKNHVTNKREATRKPFIRSIFNKKQTTDTTKRTTVLDEAKKKDVKTTTPQISTTEFGEKIMEFINGLIVRPKKVGIKNSVARQLIRKKKSINNKQYLIKNPKIEDRFLKNPKIYKRRLNPESKQKRKSNENSFFTQRIRESYKVRQNMAKHNPNLKVYKVRNLRKRFRSNEDNNNNKILVKKQSVHELLRQGGNENDCKGDIISGQIPAKIVQSLFEEVNQCEHLRKTIGVGIKAIHNVKKPIPNLENFQEQENSKDVQKIEGMLQQIMSNLNNLVKEEIKTKTCLKLDPDSKNFLSLITNGMVNPSIKQSNVRCPQSYTLKAMPVQSQEGSPRQDHFLFPTSSMKPSDASKTTSCKEKTTTCTSVRSMLGAVVGKSPASAQSTPGPTFSASQPSSLLLTHMDKVTLKLPDRNKLTDFNMPKSIPVTPAAQNHLPPSAPHQPEVKVQNQPTTMKTKALDTKQVKSDRFAPQLSLDKLQEYNRNFRNLLVTSSSAESQNLLRKANEQVANEQAEFTNKQAAVFEIPYKRRELKRLIRMYNNLSTAEKEEYRDIYNYLHQQSVILDRFMRKYSKKKHKHYKRFKEKRSTPRLDDPITSRVRKNTQNIDSINKKRVTWMEDGNIRNKQKRNVTEILGTYTSCSTNARKLNKLDEWMKDTDDGTEPNFNFNFDVT